MLVCSLLESCKSHHEVIGSGVEACASFERAKVSLNLRILAFGQVLNFVETEPECQHEDHNRNTGAERGSDLLTPPHIERLNLCAEHIHVQYPLWHCKRHFQIK